MMDTATVIRQRMLAGERPSVILRSLMAPPSDLPKNDLAHELAEAFPEEDHWIFIYAVWHWKAREKLAVWDTLFDFRLIHEVISNGLALPWTIDECERQLQAIQPEIDSIRCAEQLEADKKASFESLKERILQLPGRPACIEALWDGDTNGWFIELSVIMKDAGKYTAHYLVRISKGNDHRLFTGQVPPWPEAIHVNLVGGALAEYFGAQLYFPGPQEPDNNHPTWLEKFHGNAITPNPR